VALLTYERGEALLLMGCVVVQHRGHNNYLGG